MSETSAAVLVVVASGEEGEHIDRISTEHAAFDPGKRQVLRRGDHAYPPDELIVQWSQGTRAAAIVLDACHRPVVVLERGHAMSEGWVEDAFVRACR